MLIPSTTMYLSGNICSIKKKLFWKFLSSDVLGDISGNIENIINTKKIDTNCLIKKKKLRTTYYYPIYNALP